MLSSLPIYYVSLFKMPVKVAKELDKIQSRFLWGDGDSKRKLHMVGWDQITKSMDQGGLGIRRNRVMNDCLLLKWWWRYGFEVGSLWKRVLQEKYCIAGDLWLPRFINSPRLSKVWKDILSIEVLNPPLFNFFFSNVSLAVGNGCRTSFWKDAWLGAASLQSS